MIPYILHAGILIAAGFIFYLLLLKRLTFYALNRWVLLGCLVVAFVLPVVTIPRQWSWRSWVVAGVKAEGKDGVEKKPVDAVRSGEKKKEDAVMQQKIDAIVAQALQEAGAGHGGAVVQPKDAHVTRTAAAGTVTAAGTRSTGAGEGETKHPVSVPTVLFYIYLAGVVFLGGNLLRQMILLLVQGYRGPVVRDGQFRIITTGSMHGPCSFGNLIFIHPHRYDPETYRQILLHEKVHAGGWHTLDILLAELGIIFQWFNPFIWFFRREVENNLEFLTDRHVLQQPGIERTSYQLSLVKVAAPDMPLAITSNYNQSLLKRRIIMMHAQHSDRRMAWKYFFLLPLFIFLAAVLNRPAALAQQVQRSQKARTPAMSAPAAAPSAAPAPVAAHVSAAAAPVTEITPAMAAPVSPAPAAGVDAGVPAVSANVNVVVNPQVHVVAPVVTVTPAIAAAFGDRTEGSWFITNYKQDSKDDKVTIELRDQTDDHHWNSSFSVPRSQLNLTSVGKVEFTLTREAGVMHFTGQFDGEQGFGHYKFQPDANYLDYMRQQKVIENDDDLVSFFLLDIKKGYVDMLHANGFADISKGHVITMAALHIDEPYIKGVRSLGYMDISEGHLITFKSLHIDKDYIDDVRKAGYDHLPAEKLVTFKSLKIDGAYLRRLPAMSSPNDIITFKSMKIDSEYVAALKREGYSDIASHDIVSLRSLDVTAEYIHGFREIGYKDLSVHNLISLKSLGVTPAYVKSFQEVGLTDMSANDLTTLKSMNITADYVKGFISLGYKDINVHHLASLKSMGITAAFVKEFNDIGFKNIPLSQLTSLKAMGINAAYVSKMKEKGLVSDDLNKYIRLKSSWD